MQNYTIVCDSSSDLSEEMLQERSAQVVSLSFRFDGEKREYKCQEMECKAFYDKMREGQVAKTSGVNTADFTSMFESILKEGKDVIYIGFSSALSMTYSAACSAVLELRDKYPERKIATVDSLCASAGIALLIDLVLEKKSQGATFDEIIEFAETIKSHICHWFTVDDLTYLKRGGRVSPGSAFFGNMLGIKPLLFVDNGGRLICKAKVRGRQGAILALCEKYNTLHIDSQRVYISHADCPGDAERLADILTEKYGAKTSLITNVGPVIGAHSGPGTLALFFIGKER